MSIYSLRYLQCDECGNDFVDEWHNHAIGMREAAFHRGWRRVKREGKRLDICGPCGDRMDREAKAEPNQ